MSGATILVVDDEPDLEALVVQKFRHQIREGSIAFLFAADGVEALAIIAANPAIDMVVTDIKMPRMDGLSLLAKLQEADEKLSTVIVSAYGDMANIRTAMNCGAFDFLTKPIDFSDFEATVRKTLGHVVALREARRRQFAAERAHASLSRYFSPNLVERLVADAEALTRGSQRREVASVFTDIAGFTPLVEALAPEDLGTLLSDYLNLMTSIVFAHEGTVTKIVGDAIHILFGAPSDQADLADRAISCALALDAQSEAFRAAWLSSGVPLGATRIGVHAGPAIVGNFGAGSFFDYSAYGDTINTAARLESANKQLGTRICVSATTAERAGDFCGRPIGDLMLRGKSEALRTFEPMTREDFSDPRTADYTRAFQLLERNSPDALQAFATLVGLRPDDPLAGFHLRRLLNGSHGPVITID